MCAGRKWKACEQDFGNGAVANGRYQSRTESGADSARATFTPERVARPVRGGLRALGAGVRPRPEPFTCSRGTHAQTVAAGFGRPASPRSGLRHRTLARATPGFGRAPAR